MKDISKTHFVKIPLNNPNKMDYVTGMDLSRPCILVLGGENTDTPEWARNYCITIAKTLYLNGIKGGLDIYSACYKLRDRNSGLDRLNLFREFRDTKSLFDYSNNGLTMADITYMNLSYPLSNTYPNYIYDVINFAFMPRLLGASHQIQSTKKIRENFRNMIIFTHCHGTYVLRMIEKYLHQESNNFTYSLQDMYEIQKSIFVINHAPFAPLEQCKFSALSFASASDEQINYYNELSYHMRTTSHNFRPAFFGPKFGNIMITSRIKEDLTKEHSQVGLSGDLRDEHTLTENGRILFATERNALLEGTRAMLAGKPIPAIPKLICDPDDNFDFNYFKTCGQQICMKLGIRNR
ncbi:MAG: hypothetical protein IJX89_00075 [Alphaproteobacteria bacterium]|nr:hypothetical protein [Alphaproteobacteria bacterium]